MGLLKHFTLPLLVLIHGFQVYQIYINGKESLPEFYKWPNATNTSTTTLSNHEIHLIGIIGSTSIMLCILNLLGVLFENSHYRSIIVSVQTIYFTSEAINAYIVNYPITVKLILGLLCAGSLMIHSMEPGIFTTDKKTIEATRPKTT